MAEPDEQRIDERLRADDLGDGLHAVNVRGVEDFHDCGEHEACADRHADAGTDCDLCGEMLGDFVIKDRLPRLIGDDSGKLEARCFIKHARKLSLDVAFFDSSFCLSGLCAANGCSG
jgi:hypothetical protein